MDKTDHTRPRWNDKVALEKAVEGAWEKPWRCYISSCSHLDGEKKLVWLRFTKRYLKQQVCVWFTSASGHTESLSSGCPLTLSLGHSDDLWTHENRTRASDLYAWIQYVILLTFKSRQNVYFDIVFSSSNGLSFDNKESKSTLLDTFCFKPNIPVNSSHFPVMFKANLAGTSQ